MTLGKGQWGLLESASELDRARILTVSETEVPREGLGARFYNVAWRLGPDPDWQRLRAFALRDNSETKGFAPFLLKEWPLVFYFGEVRVGSAHLLRFTMVGDIYISPAAGREYEDEAARQLLDTMLPMLGPSEAAFFEGLPVDRPTYQLLHRNSAIASRFITIQIGDPFEHQFVVLPQTFQDYLQAMGSRSRQSVQYKARRLEREMSGHVEVVKFDSVDTVDRFLTDAVTVSSKTYQTHLLGLGIHDDDQTRAQLRFAAERGWLRSYILYCRDLPSAFMLGHQYGGCYYYDDVGYDPKFAKWSVGSVLQLKMLEELIGSPTQPDYFDFSTGCGRHKGRFGTASRLEANVLVLPKTARNAALARAYRACTALSKFSVQMFDRFGVKDRVKKYVRRLKSS
jgi:Acetyltransferase (GNAT) domain